MEKKIIPFLKQNGIYLIINLCAFLTGRAVIFQNLNPMSIAFLSSFCLKGKSFYPICIFAFLGILTKASEPNLIKYAICIGLIAAANLMLTGVVNKHHDFICALLSSMSLLISGLFISMINSFMLYYIILAFLEAILVFSLSFVIRKGVNYFENKQYTIENEELLSLSIILGCILSGSADIYVGSISLMHYFLIFALIIMSYKAGAAAGAAAGLLFSAVLALSGHISAEAISVFAIASAFSGFFRKYGKAASVFSFFTSGLIFAFFIDRTIITNELLYSAIFAFISFFIIPQQLFKGEISEFQMQAAAAGEYSLRIKDITNSRLKGFSNAFNRLAKTFSSLSEKRTSLSNEEVSKLIDDIAEKVCKNCNMNIFCWQNNFYKTYQTVFGLLAACENSGSITNDDIPQSFKNSCINMDKFADTTNRLYEMYKINLTWKNRITESRQLVSRQLFGVSKIINSLLSELDKDLNFKDNLNRMVKNELNSRKIPFENISVIENSQNRIEVLITHPSCYSRNFCQKQIIPAVSQALGIPMAKCFGDCRIKKNGDNSLCRLKIVEEQKYKITTGFANAIKTGSHESGDCYTYMELENGTYLIAISDGMGSGAKAKEESAASIELFEDFLDAGFDKDTAIEIINSVLVLKSSDDCFSTLDICTFNLYSATAEFIKIGAASSYIIREDKIEIIKSSSLPVGILSDIDHQIAVKHLKDSDIIVMATDGITDSLPDIKSILEKCRSKTPQEISDYVLSIAKQRCFGNLKDDMTVLTAKVWKKLV